MTQTQRQDWFDGVLLPLLLQVLLWGYAASVVFSFFAAPVGKFDDAIPLVHGMLVQQGRIPDVDFYSFYPPLSLYVNAALFSLMGRTVLAVRLLAALLYFFILFLATRFFLVRFHFSRSLASAAAFLLAAAVGNTIGHPGWSGFAISIAALLTYLYSQGGARSPLWAVGLSGLIAGCALLYRINFGAYVVMVVGFDLLLPWCSRGAARRDRSCLKGDLMKAAAFLGPLAVFCASFCFWVYGRHALTTVLTLAATAQRVMIVRFIELPFSMWIACAVALPSGWFFFHMLIGKEIIPVRAVVPAAFVFGILSIVLIGRAHFAAVPMVVVLEIASVVSLHLFVHPLPRSELSLLLFFCCFVHYYLSRADWPHCSLLLIAGALLFSSFLSPRSGCAESEHEPSVPKGTAMAVLVAASFLCFASPELRPSPTYIPKGVRLLASLLRHPHLRDTNRVLGPVAPDAPWLSLYPDEDELRALRYLRANTGSADAIFVGVPDHSRIYTNNLRTYWLAGRPIGTRTFQLETRIATEPQVQQGIITDLEQNHVKWVIIDAEPWVPDPTFVNRPYVGSKMLDEFIASHYREEARFGSYAVLSLLPGG